MIKGFMLTKTIWLVRFKSIALIFSAWLALWTRYGFLVLFCHQKMQSFRKYSYPNATSLPSTWPRWQCEIRFQFQIPSVAGCHGSDSRMSPVVCCMPRQFSYVSCSSWLMFVESDLPSLKMWKVTLSTYFYHVEVVLSSCGLQLQLSQ